MGVVDIDMLPERSTDINNLSEWDRHMHVFDAVEMLSRANIPGAAAQDMLDKFAAGDHDTGHSAFTRRYFAICELYGRLSDKVKLVKDNIIVADREAAEDEVGEIFDDTVGLHTVGQLLAVSKGREEESHEFLARLHEAVATEAAGSQEDEHVEGALDLSRGNDKALRMPSREQVSAFLKEVYRSFDALGSRDWEADFDRWTGQASRTELATKRILEEIAEAQKDTYSLIALSKFLAEEFLSSHIIHGARSLAELHEALEERMTWVTRCLDIDDNVTVKSLAAEARKQDLTNSSFDSLDGDEDNLNASSSELSEIQRMMVMARERQRRAHKRVMADLWTSQDEHTRKIELNRSLYEHMVVTTGGVTLGPGSSPTGFKARKHRTVDLNSIEKDKTGPSTQGSAASRQLSRMNTSSVTNDGSAASRQLSRTKTTSSMANNLSPAEKEQRQHLEAAASRLLYQAKVYLSRITAAVAERDIIFATAVRTVRKLIKDGDLKQDSLASQQHGDTSSDLPSIAGPDRREARILEARRTVLWKDINSRTVPVSIEDLMVDEPFNSPLHSLVRTLVKQESQEEEEEEEEPPELKKPTSAKKPVFKRRHAVVMDQHSMSNGKASTSAPTAFLQQLAELRDDKAEVLSQIMAEQERIAKEVAQDHPESAWDFKVEAQTCRFGLNAWQMIVDTLTHDGKQMKPAVSLLVNRPDILKGLERVLDECKSVQHHINEHIRKEEEERHRRAMLGEEEAKAKGAKAKGAEGEDPEADVDRATREEFHSLVQELVDAAWYWLQMVQTVDLKMQLSANKTSNHASVKVKHQQVQALQKKATEVGQSMTEVQQDVKALSEEKDVVEGLKAGYPVMKKATASKEQAGEELVALKARIAEIKAQADELNSKIEEEELEARMIADRMRDSSSSSASSGADVRAPSAVPRQPSLPESPGTRPGSSDITPAVQAMQQAGTPPGSIGQTAVQPGVSSTTSGTTLPDVMPGRADVIGQVDAASQNAQDVGVASLPPAQTERAGQASADQATLHERAAGAEGNVIQRARPHAQAGTERTVQKDSAAPVMQLMRTAPSTSDNAKVVAAVADQKHSKAAAPDARRLVEQQRQADALEEQKRPAADTLEERKRLRAEALEEQKRQKASAEKAAKSTAELARLVKSLADAELKCKVTTTRLERKKQDLKNMLQRIKVMADKEAARAGGGQAKPVKKLRDSEEGWRNRVAELSRNVASGNGMMNYWQERYETWFEEVERKFNEDVVRELQKVHEQEVNFGKARDVTALRSAVLRQWLKDAGIDEQVFFASQEEEAAYGDLKRNEVEEFLARQEQNEWSPGPVGERDRHLPESVAAAPHQKMAKRMSILQFGGEMSLGPGDRHFPESVAAAPHQKMAKRMSILQFGGEMSSPLGDPDRHFPESVSAGPHKRMSVLHFGAGRLNQRDSVALDVNLAIGSPHLTARASVNQRSLHRELKAAGRNHGRAQAAAQVNDLLAAVWQSKDDEKHHRGPKSTIEFRSRLKEGHLYSSMLQKSPFQDRKIMFSPATEEEKEKKTRSQDAAFSPRVVKRKKSSFEEQGTTLAAKELRRLRAARKLTDEDMDVKPEKGRKKGPRSMLSRFLMDVEPDLDEQDDVGMKAGKGDDLWDEAALPSVEPTVGLGGEGETLYDPRTGNLVSRAGHGHITKTNPRQAEVVDAEGVLAIMEQGGNALLGVRRADWFFLAMGAPRAADDPEEDAIWMRTDREQQALSLLRECRQGLVRRFGSVDRAFAQFALSGLTAEIFETMSSGMGFTVDHAEKMFDLIQKRKPLTKREREAKTRRHQGPQLFMRSKQAAQENRVTRAQFIEVFRRCAPVKNLRQLRRRLRIEYSRTEVAVEALCEKRQAVDKEGFRDFLLQHGISGLEARSLWLTIADNKEDTSSRPAMKKQLSAESLKSHGDTGGTGLKRQEPPESPKGNGDAGRRDLKRDVSSESLKVKEDKGRRDLKRDVSSESLKGKEDKGRLDLKRDVSSESLKGKEDKGSGGKDSQETLRGLPTEELTRSALLASLAYAEGLHAAEILRGELVNIISSRGGVQKMISSSRGRRAATIIDARALEFLKAGDQGSAPSLSHDGLSEPGKGGLSRSSSGFSSESSSRANSKEAANAKGTTVQSKDRAPASTLPTMRRLPTAEAIVPTPQQSLQSLSKRSSVAEAFQFNLSSLDAMRQAENKQKRRTSVTMRDARKSSKETAILEKEKDADEPTTVHEDSNQVTPAVMAGRAAASMSMPKSRGLSGQMPRLQMQETGSWASPNEKEASFAVTAASIRKDLGLDSGGKRVSLPVAKAVIESPPALAQSASSQGSTPLRVQPPLDKAVGNDTSVVTRGQQNDSESEEELPEPSQSDAEVQLIKGMVFAFCNIVLDPGTDPWEPVSDVHFVVLMRSLTNIPPRLASALFYMAAVNIGTDTQVAPFEILVRALGGFGNRYHKLRKQLGLQAVDAFDVHEVLSQHRKRAEERKGRARRAHSRFKEDFVLGGLAGHGMRYQVSGLAGKIKKAPMRRARKSIAKRGTKSLLLVAGATSGAEGGSEGDGGALTSKPELGEGIEVSESKKPAFLKRQERRNIAIFKGFTTKAKKSDDMAAPSQQTDVPSEEKKSKTKSGGRRVSLGIGTGEKTQQEEDIQNWEFTPDEVTTLPAVANERVTSKKSPNTAELQQLQLMAAAELQLVEKRLSLFGDSKMEREIGLRALRSNCVLLLKAAKGVPGKAFELLAASKAKELTQKGLQDAFVKTLKLNPLDAGRVASWAMTVQANHQFSYHDFQHVLRFARPTPTVLDLRTRLVQRYGTWRSAVEALVPLGLCGKSQREDFSIDTFEEVMIPYGADVNDMENVFKEMDALRVSKQKGFLDMQSVRFAFEHAQTLRWLQLFQQRLGGNAAASQALAQATGDHKEFSSAKMMGELLEPLGFPEEFAEPTFAMLSARASWLREGAEVATADLELILKGLPDDAVVSSLYQVGRSENQATDLTKQSPVPGLRVVEEPLREEVALAAAQDLRRRLMAKYKNFAEAYAAFTSRDAAVGITLEEWEDKREFFEFTDAEYWANIFGLIVRWQHPRWGKKIDPPKVTLSGLASTLNSAVPLLSLQGLRTRLQSVCSSLQKAWVILAGSETAEEVSIVQWRQALLAMGVRRADASQLFSLIMASPTSGAFAQSGSWSSPLPKAAFFTSMKNSVVDASKKLLDLLMRISDGKPVSAAFEVAPYPRHSLMLHDFKEVVTKTLKLCTEEDVRILFGYLDVHREGGVYVDDLLDVLTTMQGLYFPSKVVPARGKVVVASSSRLRNCVKAMSVFGRMKTGKGLSLSLSGLSENGPVESDAPDSMRDTGSTFYPGDADSDRGLSSAGTAFSQGSPLPSANSSMERPGTVPHSDDQPRLLSALRGFAGRPTTSPAQEARPRRVSVRLDGERLPSASPRQSQIPHLSVAAHLITKMKKKAVAPHEDEGGAPNLPALRENSSPSVQTATAFASPRRGSTVKRRETTLNIGLDTLPAVEPLVLGRAGQMRGSVLPSESLHLRARQS
eukprot:TRINITY_DN6423_c0_g1_i3.p1 TRINITY_DN6423_c0_g1~~TRINITY_DN6423_c0_g1_i3.p1  ORF type:complete len:3784 (-),score=871.10 TRINITY_DN6423_c0_g1_i3:7-10608(-)